MTGRQGVSRDDSGRRPRGRPSASSRAEIERAAIRLFLAHGYADATVAMIAGASGVSRTTFFRYYHSKAEIIWAAFDRHTQHLHMLLEADPGTEPAMTVVRRCVVEALRDSADDEGIWMRRFQILDSSPDLRSEESAHWISWAAAIAEHVARRTATDPRSVVPQSIGGAVQAAFLAVLRSWIAVPDPSAALLPELDEELVPLCDLFQGWLDGRNGDSASPGLA